MSISRVVVVDDPSLMAQLIGAGDGVIRELERAFPQVDVHVRGNHLTLTGEVEDVEAAAATFEEFRAILTAGVPLTPDVARESVRMLRAVGGTGGDSPVAVLSRSILTSRGRTIRPKTQNQAPTWRR